MSDYFDRDDLEVVFDPSDNEGFDEAVEALLAGAQPEATSGGPQHVTLDLDNYKTADDLEAIGVEAVLGIAYSGLMSGAESITYKDLFTHAKSYAEAHIDPNHRIFELVEWVEGQVNGQPSIEALLSRLFGGANG